MIWILQCTKLSVHCTFHYSHYHHVLLGKMCYCTTTVSNNEALLVLLWDWLTITTVMPPANAGISVATSVILIQLQTVRCRWILFCIFQDKQNCIVCIKNMVICLIALVYSVIRQQSIGQFLSNIINPYSNVVQILTYLIPYVIHKIVVHTSNHIFNYCGIKVTMLKHKMWTLKG